jgi:hypothetical protein
MGTLLTAASQLMCPHGGIVTAIPSDPSVTLGGNPIVLATDTFIVAGCPFTPVLPHPCLLVQWQLPAAGSTAGGVAPLTTDSVGMCQAADGSVQGTVVIASTQTRVQGL